MLSFVVLTITLSSDIMIIINKYIMSFGKKYFLEGVMGKKKKKKVVLTQENKGYSKKGKSKGHQKNKYDTCFRPHAQGSP